MLKVLNVGGNNKAIPLPPQYAGFEHLLLDIDPEGQPDLLCDARQLTTLEPAQVEAVYCSHNLEHYHRHEVPSVLAGFLHVLKDGGFAHIQVPDLTELMRQVLARNLDLEATLYTAPAGPITPLDVIYGYHVEIERSGKDFFAHKTGFTLASLFRLLTEANFSKIYGFCTNLEVTMVAFKGVPDPAFQALFNLDPN